MISDNALVIVEDIPEIVYRVMDLHGVGQGKQPRYRCRIEEQYSSSLGDPDYEDDLGCDFFQYEFQLTEVSVDEAIAIKKKFEGLDSIAIEELLNQ